MRSSLRLGSVSGIPIGLHWSIAIIAGLFGVTLAGTLLPAAAPGFAGAAYFTVAAVVTIALLGSIIAHELGHSLVAQRHEVGVTGITLFALGGVAKLEREPDTPRAAAHIALAGPAVSVAIGAGALATAAIAGSIGASGLVIAGLTWLGLINISLAVFNMLPALPLDGGRALQAAMWKRSGDRDQATVSAASVGRYIGWAIVAFGAYQLLTAGSGLWTMLIGWFILSSAKAESVRARINQRRRAWNAPGDRPSPWILWPHQAQPQPQPGQPRAARPMSNPAWAPPAPGSRRPDPSTEIIDVVGQRVS